MILRLWSSPIASSAVVLGVVLFLTGSSGPGFGQAVAPPADSYTELARKLEAKVAEFDWGGGTVGGAVVDVVHGISIWERESAQGGPPGAVMMAFLAAAALDGLGPDFRFTTELLSQGEVSGKSLEGSLIVRGSGDPTITSFGGGPDAQNELWDRWTKVLAEGGIRNISGDILLDDSAFDDAVFAPGWPLDRLGEADLPEVSALNFNDNCVEFFWQKGRKDGGLAKVRVEPLLPKFIFISNNVLLSDSARTSRRYARQHGQGLITVRGTLPLKTEIHERGSVGFPSFYFGNAMRARFERKGISVVGTVKSWKPEEVRADMPPARILATATSKPLGEMLPFMVRHKRNLDAEVILKSLGRKRTGKAGSFEAGTRAVIEILSAMRVRLTGGVVLDGSGLSTLDRISPGQVMALMSAMRSHRLAADFERCFPAGGTDGILKERLASDGSNSEIRAIAGSSPGAEQLAGWTSRGRGQTIHFTFAVRDSRLPREPLARQMDALAALVAESGIH